MKQSDIIAIALIATIGVIGSTFAINALLGDPSEKTVSYKSIEVISADLDEPDPNVFNADAINPTVEVIIGQCADLDGDGQLSAEEQEACGRTTNNEPTPTPTPEPTPEPTAEPEPEVTENPEPTEEL